MRVGPRQRPSQGVRHACFLRMLNEEQRCAILDGAARIHELRLPQHIAPSLLAQLVQAQQRCAPNGTHESMRNRLRAQRRVSTALQRAGVWRT